MHSLRWILTTILLPLVLGTGAVEAADTKPSLLEVLYPAASEAPSSLVEEVKRVRDSLKIISEAIKPKDPKATLTEPHKKINRVKHCVTLLARMLGKTDEGGEELKPWIDALDDKWKKETALGEAELSTDTGSEKKFDSVFETAVLPTAADLDKLFEASSNPDGEKQVRANRLARYVWNTWKKIAGWQRSEGALPGALGWAIAQGKEVTKDVLPEELKGRRATIARRLKDALPKNKGDKPLGLQEGTWKDIAIGLRAEPGFFAKLTFNVLNEERDSWAVYGAAFADEKLQAAPMLSEEDKGKIRAVRAFLLAQAEIEKKIRDEAFTALADGKTAAKVGASVADLQIEVEALKKDNTEQAAKLKTAEEQAMADAMRLADAQKKIEELEEKLKVAVGNADKAKKAAEEAEKAKQTALTQVVTMEKDTAIPELVRKLAASEENLAIVGEDLQRANFERKNLTYILIGFGALYVIFILVVRWKFTQQRKSYTAKLQSQASANKAESARLSEELTKSREDNVKLEKERDTLSAQIKRIQPSNPVQGSRPGHQPGHTRNTPPNVTLPVSMSSNDSELRALKEENAQLEAANTKLKGEVSNLQAQLTTQGGELNKARDQAFKLEQQVDKHRRDEANLRNDWERKFKQEHDLELGQLQQDVETLRAQAAKHVSEQARLNGEIETIRTGYQDQVARLTADLESRTTEAEQFRLQAEQQAAQIEQLEEGEIKLLPSVFSLPDAKEFTTLLLNMAEQKTTGRILVSRLQVVNGIVQDLTTTPMGKARLEVERDRLADELRNVSRQWEALMKTLTMDAAHGDHYRGVLINALNYWLKETQLGFRLEAPAVPSRFDGVRMVNRAGSGDRVTAIQSWMLWGADTSRPRFQAEVET